MDNYVSSTTSLRSFAGCEADVFRPGPGDRYPCALLESLGPHASEGGRMEPVREDMRYFVRPSEQLVVGKYVPPAAAPSGDGKKGNQGDDDDNAASSSTDVGDDVRTSPTTPTALDADGLHPLHMVTPAHPSSSPVFFFPVHYASATIKDRNDSRGLPQAINAALHPGPDRPQIPTRTAHVRGTNLGTLGLFKIGPGAVAFRVVLNALEAAGLKYTPHYDLFNVLWAKRATPEVLASLNLFQKVNHFPGTWGIGRKDSLAKNIGRMKRQFGASEFDIVPASFLIPSERDQLQLDVQRATAAAGSGAPPTYIVKPSASSCGKGIKLYRGMPPMPKGEKQMVCQRYVGNPLLVLDRKFDLRMYCVVTGFDPLRIYLFDQGLVRFAAEKYPGADQLLTNSYAHLTNYSISKTAELARASKGKSHEDDEPVDIKWTISDLRRWLTEQRGVAAGVAAWATIYEGVKDVVVKAFLAIEEEVVRRVRSECVQDRTGHQCFEMFGLDLMVDDALKVTLIEANIMPSLATGSTLDKAVKARMLAHLLTLVGVVPHTRTSSSNNGTASPTAPFPEAQRPPTWLSTDRYYLSQRRGAPSGPADHTDIPLAARFDSKTSSGNSKNSHSVLTDGEQRMLTMADEELRRAGGFDRIFPTPHTYSRYAHLFTAGFLRSNYVLASWEAQKVAAASQNGGAPVKED